MGFVCLIYIKHNLYRMNRERKSGIINKITKFKEKNRKKKDEGKAMEKTRKEKG